MLNMATCVRICNIPRTHNCSVSDNLICSALVVAGGWGLVVVGKPTTPLSSPTLVPNAPPISCPIGVTALEIIATSTVKSRLHRLQVNLVWLWDWYWSVKCSHTKSTDATTVAQSFFRRTGCPGSACWNRSENCTHAFNKWHSGVLFLLTSISNATT